MVYKDGRRLVPHEFHAIKSFIADLPGVDRQNEEESFLGTVNTYTYGDARIYAVLPALDAPRQSLRLPMKKDDVAYNIFTGEKIRRPHRTKFQLLDGRPLVVTALPHEITEIVVNVPEIVHVGQRLPIQIVAKAGKGRAGKHLFIVDLMPAHGAPIPWYRRIVTAESGVAETFIPLAWNEILGKYSLRVRDILTGKQTLTPVALSSPAN